MILWKLIKFRGVLYKQQIEIEIIYTILLFNTAVYPIDEMTIYKKKIGRVNKSDPIVLRVD